MDEHVDRAIDTALDELRAVRPAPDFLPRLRAHVEQQPRRAPIRWWIPFAASASAVAAGVIVAALLRAPQVQPPAAAAPQTALAPVASDRRPLVAPPIAKPAANRVRAARRTPPAAAAPQVLVPAGQRAAVLRLLDAINAGDAHAIAVMRNLRQVAPPADVTVTPIDIPPVMVPPLKESM